LNKAIDSVIVMRAREWAKASFACQRRIQERRVTAHPLGSVDPETAGAALWGGFGVAAGSEALFRAFLAEQDRDRLAARFWINVYEAILKKDQQ
jgi:hypothetical protein